MSEWIEWNGGSIPVSKGAVVKLRLSSGEFDLAIASNVIWAKGTNIVAYQVVDSKESDKYLDADNKNSKYDKEIKGVTVDVYDVLKAFDVRCQALQHLIKKALQCGNRGHKTASEDYDDIIASAIRAKELNDD